MPDRTVGEIVAENPSQARVFQAFGIDFCCQGGRTLQEACTLKGLAVETVIEAKAGWTPQLVVKLKDGSVKKGKH